MKKIFQKITASLIITSLVLGLFLSVFSFNPKEVKAAGSVTGIDPLNWTKDWILDNLPKVIVGMIKQYIFDQMIKWAQGGNTDANESFAITDWGDFLLGAAAMGSAKYIAEFKQVFDPNDAFENSLKSSLEFLGFGTATPYLPTYSVYARPTLKNDLGVNYEAFVNSGYSLRTGGWAGWFSLMKPQNNIFGQIMMAEQARKKFEEDAKLAAIQEGQAGQGYRNESECIKDSGTEDCKKSCYDNAAGQTSEELDECLASCADAANGICLQYETKNLGSLIHSSMESVVKSDLDWIISADEITELVGLFFSGLYNRIRGQGIAQSSSSATKLQLQQYQYSYYNSFKKLQTSEDKQDLRVDVLNAILNAIKQLGIAKSCEKDRQIKGDDASTAIADVLEGEVQHLYVGMEGVNLQPDFEILDPLWGPYKYYGYAWSDVPYNKYPPKCQRITEDFGSRATCDSISSGLAPLDPNCKCLFDDNAMMCPPGPYPPVYDPTHSSFTQAILDQKANFYNSCKSQYNQVQNQCQNCLGNAKQCENKTGQEKTDCLTTACSNYTKVSGAVSGEDFYNKCLIEQAKQNCFTCLKEYYIPANYCEQVYDYINRSFVKYPLIVYEDLWWGWHDETTCSVNRSSGKIPVGLICRILPDFKYNGIKVCQQYCLNDLSAGEKEEKLENVYDFSPSNSDCQNIEIGKAINPGSQYGDYLVQQRTKCCAALNSHRPKEYAVCIGEGASEPGEPEEPEAEEQCPITAEACAKAGIDWPKISGWGSGSEAQDIGGVSNLSITYPDKHFNAITEPSSRASSNQLAKAQIISIRQGATEAEISVSQPHCWKPQECCTDTSSYTACMNSIPDDSRCRIFGGEINKESTNLKNAFVEPGKASGSLEPMWVPDPEWIERNGLPEWTVYGYCSYNPENPTDTSAYFGPDDKHAWNQGGNYICKWTDNDKSETCTDIISVSCDLSNFTKEFWTTVKGTSTARGGIAVCVEK